MDTKDLSIVVLISAAGLVYIALVNPLRSIFAGIPCSKYIFSIGNMILISLALLLYDGKRGRFFLQGLLIAFLSMPLKSETMSFTLITGMMITIVNSFHGDLIFNSYHSYFKKKNKLRHWSILTLIQYYLVSILLNIINFYLFFSGMDFQVYLNLTAVIIPIILIECLIGGEIGYRIYQRIKKPNITKNSMFNSEFLGHTNL